MKNPHFFGGNRFKDCITIGQNILLYRMYNSFANQNYRVVYLEGDQGSGKSTLSKHLANYLEERHKINDVKYVNME